MSQHVWRIPGDGEALNKLVEKDGVIEYGSGPYRTYEVRHGTVQIRKDGEIVAIVPGLGAGWSVSQHQTMAEQCDEARRMVDAMNYAYRHGPVMPAAPDKTVWVGMHFKIPPNYLHVWRYELIVRVDSISWNGYATVSRLTNPTKRLRVPAKPVYANDLGLLTLQEIKIYDIVP